MWWMCISFKNIIWSVRLSNTYFLRRIPHAPSVTNKVTLFFLTNMFVGDFISNLFGNKFVGDLLEFLMTWGQTWHRRGNNTFINNPCTYLYWKFQTTWFCAASGVTFWVHEPHQGARQRISSPASQCRATPQCQSSGVKWHLAIQHHFGNYLIFRINRIFLNTGRSFCLYLLQRAMRSNIFGRVSLFYLCVCRQS